ncbi:MULTISPECIES: TraE/TraK family type IV conjugative transfer system protein [Pseudomonas fluorescens group]|jgi:conjugal transfer pilus assembly protein TraE|uniref:Uncharacterized protein n=1 Tax=Pseudomonas fluorescens (strain SBW25) TaxID=216595 RepID=A0A0G4E5W7_PSEFS|nr:MULTISPECIES: TraE/TraK family type IV conjugative transfer system protein [Pseudomonas fluorescens group]MCP1515668.1 conjugal transfer pilus assembly protein TraE [Pseudomonas rhodesiae]MDF9772916.1 conjugal transfer pilus assembly protein TraE [Pseudomonas rhodesiae]CEK42559.1 hypothetical protein PQBR55_0180 [Pseudomonas fluorescens SBW25]
MLSKLFGNTAASLKKENATFKVLLYAMVITNFLLTIVALNKESIQTITPPTLVEQAWVDENSASDSYTEAWAMYVALVLGNVTPGTADMIQKIMDPLLSPDIYQDFVNLLQKQVGEIRRDRVILKFEARKITKEPGKPNLFYVSGRSTMEGPTGKKEREDRTYVVEIRIKRYKPIIEFVDTYKGGPRTETVQSRLDRAEENKDRRRQERERERAQ